MIVGTNLKRLRKQVRYSQQEMSEMLGIDRKTYGNWENGKTDVKTKYIVELAKIFQIEINELFKNNSES
ncbi:MAG TPA: helix-turn-helix transcriptional regulator [Flavobacterium sp.]|nr:helix-turn-helix transcriptional regulator [Flavobacterium sp.]